MSSVITILLCRMEMTKSAVQSRVPPGKSKLSDIDSEVSSRASLYMSSI